MSFREVLAARRAEVIGRWLEQTLGTYPPAAARLLAVETDPFRNPAGHTLRESVALLFDAAILSDDWPAANGALGQIIRLRAVQDFNIAQAVGFVALLKPIVRDLHLGGEAVATIEARIDRLTELALSMYQDCRVTIERLRVNEARRCTWNVARVRTGNRQ